MSDGRKRLSGSGYKNLADEKKRKQELEISKIRKINTIFEKSNKLTADEGQFAEIKGPTEDDTAAPTDPLSFLEHTKENDTLSSQCHLTVEVKIANHPQDDHQEADIEDPSQWFALNDALRIQLVKRGSRQIMDVQFPLDDKGRKFSSHHYKRNLVNGESVTRSWLVYSKSKNVVFCFSCKLFTKESMALTSSGCCDWKNMSAILSSHEVSLTHIKAYMQWKELEVRLRTENTIDAANQRVVKQEVEHWRQVLERLIGLVRVHAVQNLAFRGSSDKLFTSNNGNFLQFVEYLGSFDPVMKEHIRRIKSDEIHVHYAGKNIQNEIIGLLAKKVRDEILSEAKNAKYFSIIIDCTPDVSHVEQMTFVIRFVSLCEAQEERVVNVAVHEHFLQYEVASNTTGAGMTNLIVKKIEEMGLVLTNLRGQGYDNGSNMKGKHNGVQKKILDLNPRAFYVPCTAHSLNLVVNDAAHSCTEAVKFFGVVQAVYVFFSASTHRWKVLMNNVSGLTVKPLSETRWSSRVNAVRVLRYQIGEVYDALVSIIEDTTLTGVTGAQTRAHAQGIAFQLRCFKFVVSVVVWYNILYEVNFANKLLQSQSLDMSEAVTQLNKTIQYLVNYRSDDSFLKTLEDAEGLETDLEIDPTFPAVTQVRARTKKRMFQYEAADDQISDPRESFKCQFFFVVLDAAINSMEERFTLLNAHHTLFGFLSRIGGDNQSATLLEKCRSLEKALTDDSDKDIDALRLFEEIQCLQHRIQETKTPKQLLEFICANQLCSVLPNLSVALRILLTLPVSVAAGESSFSKLKIIKNYLRSSMAEDRLSDLAILSIEKEMVSKVDIGELAREFASIKIRRIPFFSD